MLTRPLETDAHGGGWLIVEANIGFIGPRQELCALLGEEAAA